jgi:predicted metalloprotease
VSFTRQQRIALLAAVTVAAVAAVLAVVLIGGGKKGFGYHDPFDGYPKGGPPGTAREIGGAPDSQQRMVAFLRFVSADVQTFWNQEFQRAGAHYRPAPVVVFHNVVETGCGEATSAVGPFYCPLDRSVYLDLGFFRALAVKFKAPGDFADAYVLAHEIGHHVQNLLGTSDKVQKARGTDQKGATGLSVRLELQADCFAGIWAQSSSKRDLLENGDLEEALGAAAAIGDDRLQRQSRGTVNPEKWTHGSSEQRSRWFQRGFKGGKLENCDTFEGAPL